MLILFKAAVPPSGYLAVDLDGTLAQYHGDHTTIGPPVPKMLARVRRWLAEGRDVRIFTARVAGPDAERQRRMIAAWCREHLGRELPVTHEKSPQCIRLYDDRAVQVRRNTGELVKGIALNRATGRMYGYQGADNTPVASPGPVARLKARMSFRQRGTAVGRVQPILRGIPGGQHSEALATSNGGQIYRHTVQPTLHFGREAATELGTRLKGAGFHIGQPRQESDGRISFTAKHRRSGEVHQFHIAENPHVQHVHSVMAGLGNFRGTQERKEDREGPYFRYQATAPHDPLLIDARLRQQLGHQYTIHRRDLQSGETSFTLHHRQSGLRQKLVVKTPIGNATANARRSSEKTQEMPAQPQAKPGATPRSASPAKPAKPAPTAARVGANAPTAASTPPAPSPTDTAPELGRPQTRDRSRHLNPELTASPRSNQPDTAAPPRKTTSDLASAEQRHLEAVRQQQSDRSKSEGMPRLDVVKKGRRYLALGHLGEVLDSYPDEGSARARVEHRKRMLGTLQREV